MTTKIFVKEIHANQIISLYSSMTNLIHPLVKKHMVDMVDDQPIRFRFGRLGNLGFLNVRKNNTSCRIIVFLSEKFPTRNKVFSHGKKNFFFSHN